MGPQACVPRGKGTAAVANTRANASRLPHRGTGREALGFAESPHLPGERTPRAHGGARPRTLTHTRCTLTASPAPPLCQGLRAPSTSAGPTQFTQTQNPTRVQGDRPAEASDTEVAPPPIPEASLAGIPQYCADTARLARTQGKEEGAAP